MSEFAAQVVVVPQKTIVTVAGDNAVVVQNAVTTVEVTTIGVQGASGSGGGGSGDATSIQGKALSAASPSSGDVLRYNGTAWVNYAEANLVDGGNF